MANQLTITVGGVDITDYVPLETVVVKESGCRERGSFECDVRDVGTALTLSPKAQVTVYDAGDARYIFTGFLNPAALAAFGLGRSFHLSCDDLGEILDMSLVPSEQRNSESFRTRMIALLSTYGPLLPQNWTYIENLAVTVPATLIEKTTLRGAIEGTCSLAGTTCDYFIDGAGLVHAGTALLGAAPFKLRSSGTLLAGEVWAEEPFSITRDPKSMVTAYYINGKNAAGSGWVTDPVLVAHPELRREQFYDAPDADTGPKRDAVGNALLADNASASLQGQVHITAANGWRPGQTLTVQAAAQFDISSPQSYRLNTAERRYTSGGTVKSYDLQFGGLIPKWSTSIPTPQAWPGSRLASGSLDITPFASTIRPVAIVSSLPALPDAAYPDGSLVFLTTDHRLYHNVSGAWSKAVDGADLVAGSVGITKFASSIRPVSIVGALPALPDSDYPEGSVCFLTPDHKLYRNVSGTWSKAVDGADIVANSITAGQIAAGAIGTSELASHAVTADRIAANTITANEIAANTLTAGEIAAGAIGVSELAASAVTADAIAAGAIDASKLQIGYNRNLCPNNSFEFFTGSYNVDMPDSATVAGSLPGWATCSAHTGLIAIWGPVQTGLRYQGSNILALRQGAAPADVWVRTVNVPVEPGRAYALRGFLRGAAGNSATAVGRVAVQWYQSDGTTFVTSTYTGAVVGTSTTWQECATRVTAPANGHYARIIVYNLAASGANDYVYADSLEFYEASYDSAQNVIVDPTGIAITGGKLSVTNPGGTVIIDGTSNMFKIATTGTITRNQAANGGGTTSIGLGGFGLDTWKSPSFTGYLAEGNPPADNANRDLGRFMNIATGFVAQTSGGATTQRMRYIFYQGNLYSNTDGSGTPQINLGVDNADASAHAISARYYIFKEAAI